MVGAGYALPTPIPIAPGQVITLFARGVGEGINNPVIASVFPLPATLAGISVAMRQAIVPDQITPVPILAIFRAGGCASSTFERVAPCTVFTAITVQTPYELIGNQPGSLMPYNDAIFIVSENGVNADAIPLLPQTDRVHLLSSCDAVPGSCFGFSGSPLISHADGSLVSSHSPARAGEAVVLYAFGLGATQPATPTGQAPGIAAAPGTTVGLEFRANASPASPPVKPVAPSYAGTAPGYAGLYQINVTIPSIPADTPACGSGVKSNLTITVQQTVSYDGAGICVAP